jgi:signal transduction histidine kinase
MSEKLFIIIGGALTAVFGVFFLIDFLVNSQKIDYFIMVALPICLILTGASGVLAGVVNNERLFTITNIVGKRLALFAVLMLGSAYLVQPEFGIYLLSIILLIVSINIFHTGLEAEDKNGWDVYIISHSISRLVFIVLLAIPFNNIFREFAGKIGPLAFASYFVWFFVIFEALRSGGKDFRIVKMIFKTIFAFLMLVVFMVLLVWFDWLVSWFSNLTIIIPLAGIAIALCISGNLQGFMSGNVKIYYRGKGNYLYRTDKNDVFTYSKNGGFRKMSAEAVEEMDRKNREEEEKKEREAMIEAQNRAIRMHQEEMRRRNSE